MVTKTKKLTAALAKYEKAREDFEKAVRTELPGRSPVAWKHGHHNQYGIVIDHGYRGRVMVENERTGSRKWFDAEKFIRGT